MTDLKNIIKVSFSDDGVSVICVTVHAILFFPFYFYFYFSRYGLIVKRWHAWTLPICCRCDFEERK